MNIDQTGVVLVPGANDATYKIKRAKQVLIHRTDEKSAFIDVLSGFCKDKDFSVQSIWKRATSVSLPTKKASQEAFAGGHRFALIKILMEVHLLTLKHGLERFSCYIEMK